MSVLRADPAAPATGRGDGRLTLDRLPNRHDPVEVVLLEGFEVGSRDGDDVREPHRHDYHELIWTRTGAGHHLLDNRTVPVVPGTITVIGRGQVHVLERARGFAGAAVRFGELLHEGPIARADPAWMLGGCGGWNVTVPRSHYDALEATIAALAAEAKGPLDARSADLQRHLLSVLLLWIERWYDGQRTERRDGDDAALELFRRFSRLLERDFAAHHDAGHYADALAMPQATLSHALSQVVGRSTKELVTDRVMMEATRLLTFTDRTIGEIAFQTGFGDPLYFSRAFKRHTGEPPTAFRDRTRGVV